MLVLAHFTIGNCQELLWELDAHVPCGDDTTSSGLLGVCSIDDLDGGGLPDLLVGAELHGNLFVYSSETREVLFCFDGYGGLGGQVASVGDFDGDGTPDYAAAAIRLDYNAIFSGLVMVFSGSNGERIALIPGPAVDGLRLGTGLDGAGDVNGDGYSDLVIGSRTEHAQVNLGPDGRLLRSHGDPLSVVVTRAVVAGVGDMNHDNHDDYVVAVHNDPTNGIGAGRVTVHSGVDGGVIHEVYGDPIPMGGTFGDSLGWSVSRMGDVNGDGTPDFAASALRSPRSGLGAEGPGYVRVYSGADASIIWEITAETGQLDFFGYSISGGRDVNGDGISDLVVGAPFEDIFIITGGSVSVFSGKSEQMLWKAISTDLGESWGRSAFVLDDLDGDGFGEFAISQPVYGDVPQGRILIFKGGPGDVTPTCPALPNSTGAGARIDPFGPISVGNDRLRLGVGGVPAHTSLLFAYSMGGAVVPFGNGTLCLAGVIHRVNDPTVSDDTGTAETPLSFSEPPAGSGPGQILPGDTWHVQCWYRDAAAGGAFFNLSDALAIQFTL